LQMVAPRCEYQQCFAQRIHRLVQDQLTQCFCQGRTTRLTCQGDLTTLVFESSAKPSDMGRLARPIDAFET
jgi:secreted trypsin-like serine protease